MLNLLLHEFISVIILKPRMCFNLIRTILPKSIRRLPLYQLRKTDIICRNQLNSIYEIRPSNRSSLRNLLLLYPCLLRQNLIPYLSSTPPLIRPPTQHKLIRTYTHRIVINGNSMVLTTHYLWCHIPWCPGCVA